ncbi:hypothetical protein NDU88_010106 [Pleurodeles waltl]|uniref:Uncharacterized protein n=1 Tax=Pleurodeles waltl TaxID=8319 RepID=A0AAV7Q0Z3_PLEWA|nr:hypothetical protein NDU88_010106 [Pleurodeles waltl]
MKLLATSEEMVRDSQHIAEVFTDYMESFNSTQLGVDEEEVLTFDGDCLGPQQARDLKADVSSKEVSLAMGQMQAEKAVAPNGLLVELFCKLTKRTVEPLQAADMAAFTAGELLEDMRMATVVLIPKPGSNKTRLIIDDEIEEAVPGTSQHKCTLIPLGERLSDSQARSPEAGGDGAGTVRQRGLARPL